MASLLVASSQSTISNAFIQNVVTVSQTTAANTNGTLFFLRNVQSITTTKTVAELGISGRTISQLVSSDGTTGLNAIVRPGTTFSVSGSVDVATTGLGTTPTANTYMVTSQPYTDSDISLSYPYPPFISNGSSTSNHIAVGSSGTLAGPASNTYGGTFTHSGTYYEVSGYISGTTFTATYVAGNFGIMSGHVLTTRDLTVTTNDHTPINGTQIATQLTGQLSGTGTISGFTLTLTGAVTGLAVGATISAANVLPYTTIVAGAGLSWTVSRSHSISSTTTFSFGGLTGTYSVTKSQTLGSAGSTKTFRIGGTYGLTAPMGIFTEDLPSYVSGQNTGAGNIGGGAYYYFAANSTSSSFGSYASGISTQLSPHTLYVAGALYYFCPTVWIPFVCNHASGNGPVQTTSTLYFNQLLDTRTNSITFNQGVSVSVSNKKPSIGITLPKSKIAQYVSSSTKKTLVGVALPNNVKQMYLSQLFYSKIAQYVSSSTQKTLVGVALPNNVKQMYLSQLFYSKIAQNEIISNDNYNQTFFSQTFVKAKKSVELAVIITIKEILDFSSSLSTKIRKKSSFVSGSDNNLSGGVALRSTLVARNDDELEIKSTSITNIKTTSVKQGGTTIIVSGSGGSADPYWS